MERKINKYPYSVRTTATDNLTGQEGEVSPGEFNELWRAHAFQRRIEEIGNRNPEFTTRTRIVRKADN
jgi:hypothetical protein